MAGPGYSVLEAAQLRIQDAIEPRHASCPHISSPYTFPGASIHSPESRTQALSVLMVHLQPALHNVDPSSDSGHEQEWRARLL